MVNCVWPRWSEKKCVFFLFLFFLMKRCPCWEDKVGFSDVSFFFLLFFFHCFFLAVKYQWKIWKVLSISTSLRISRCMSDPIVRPREIEYPKQLWGVEMAGGVWRIIFLSTFNGKSFHLISAGDSLRLGRLNAGGGNGVGRFFLWGGECLEGSAVALVSMLCFVHIWLADKCVAHESSQMWPSDGE